MKTTTLLIALIVGGYAHDNGYLFAGYILILIAGAEYAAEVLWPCWKSWRSETGNQ